MNVWCSVRIDDPAGGHDYRLLVIILRIFLYFGCFAHISFSLLSWTQRPGELEFISLFVSGGGFRWFDGDLDNN